MPLGKSVCRSASRLGDPFAPAARSAVLARPRARRRLVVRVVAVAGAGLVVCFAAVWLVAPGILWLWWRWAPSEAARVKVRPHSGHLNSVVAVVVFAVGVGGIAGLLLGVGDHDCNRL